MQIKRDRVYGENQVTYMSDKVSTRVFNSV